MKTFINQVLLGLGRLLTLWLMWKAIHAPDFMLFAVYGMFSYWSHVFMDVMSEIEDDRKKELKKTECE